MKKKRVWIPILMSIAITFLITIQAVTHVQNERSRADVNQDGIINILDLVIVAKYLSKQEDMKPVLTPEPIPEQPIPEIDAQETVYPEITFENVLDLTPGEKYRLRPTEASEGRSDEGVIYDISWGSVAGNPPMLLEGFTEDDPKIKAWFSMTNDDLRSPYAKTLDGKPVIAKEPVWDEIVIEIVVNQWGGGIQQTGGPRGNKFEFTLVEYSAILIENLTHPDRKFEYE